MFIIWRERLLIAAVMVFFVLLSGVFLLVVSPIYTGTARISVKQDMSPLAGIQYASANDGAAGNYLFTEQHLIESPAVLALAAQMPDLRPLLAGRSSPIKFLQSNLLVLPGNRSTTLSVSFSSRDRDQAATVANAIVRAYIQYQTRPKTASGAELERMDGERARLEQRIADITGQMLELERTYGALAITKGQDSLAERQLAGLSQDLHLAHLQTLSAQAERDEAQVPPAEAASNDPDANNDPAVPLGPGSKKLLRTTLLQLDVQLKDLLRQYLPEHPLVVEAQRRLNAMRVVYARAIGREYHIAQQHEHDLQAEYDAQEKQTIAVSAAMKQYVRMKLDLESDRTAQKQIDDRRRQIEMARDLGALSIDPFEPAQPQLTSTRPRISRIVPMGLVFGFFFGITLAFLRDWFDDRFRTIDEMRGSINLPLLGTLPRMPNNMGNRTVGQQALLEPVSPLAEACRLIRNAIQLATAKNRSSSVMITSPCRGDGKSILVSNLAITMARAGKRVLLLDANLRYPSQHGIFGLPNDQGLTSLLEGRTTFDQAVQPSEIQGLDILPAGPACQNPPEMLNRPAFNELIESLLEYYDQVLIDSAPVLGISDSRMLAAACDGTILVLRAGASTRRLSELAEQSVTSVGTPVLGMVINQAADGSTAEVLDRYTRQSGLVRVSQ